MTTDELVEKLTELGVADAEFFRDMRLKNETNSGPEFKVPVLTPDDRMYVVRARFTGEAQDFVPEWLDVVQA